MKKVIYLLILLLISLTQLFADWDLYKKDITYYYFNGDYNVDIKFLQSSDNPNLLYSKVFLDFKKDECFDSLKPLIDIFDRKWYADWNGLPVPDSILINNDTTFIPLFNNNYYFYLITNQKPGDSVLISNIIQKDTINYTIKCDSISLVSIFNAKDSARYYSINKTINSSKCFPRSIILSKSYGIIYSNNWEKILNLDCEEYYKDPLQLNLVGIDDGIKPLGYSFKPFMDAFTQIKTGDILVWIYSYVYGYSGNTGKIREEITSTYLADSVFSYTSNIAKADHGFNYNNYDKYTLTFEKNVVSYVDLRALRKLFDMSANTFFESNLNLGSLDFNNFNEYITKDGYKRDKSRFTADSVEILATKTTHILIDNDSCKVGSYLSEPSETFLYFSSDVGFLERNTGNNHLEDISKSLMGYVRDGKVYGDTTFDWDVSVNEPKWLSNFSISPNPASDYIYINSSLVEGTGGVWQYQIYDILGNCVQSGTIESNKINIARLLTGFYTLRFFCGEKQIVEKLIKE
ncbi:MAG TPA: T9SS type A sorting domain-containing protein [Candidatus Kapabacteria bacterium]|nr:T9SS type A sorting domain-containing protein [Candidatus Kapabacteria bacterium]